MTSALFSSSRRLGTSGCKDINIPLWQDFGRKAQALPRLFYFPTDRVKKQEKKLSFSTFYVKIQGMTTGGRKL